MSLLVGALLSAGLGLGKAIFGGLQASNAKNKAEKMVADKPVLDLQQEYVNALDIARNRSAGNMPGLGLYEQLGAEATARSMQAAREGAISSNVYQGAVDKSNLNELDYLRDLAMKNVAWKDMAKQQQIEQENLMGQRKDTLWDVNVNQKWQMQKNIETGERQAGMQNLFAGLGDISSTVMNFVGTKYYTDVLKNLYNPKK